MKKTLKIVMMVALIAVTAVVLFACVPSSIDTATKKMEKAGYTVTSAQISAEGCEGAFTATKISISEGSGMMTALYFKDNATAKNYYEKIYGENKNSKDNVIKSKGRWVYSGSSAAIAAFEK